MKTKVKKTSVTMKVGSIHNLLEMQDKLEEKEWDCERLREKICQEIERIAETRQQYLLYYTDTYGNHGVENNSLNYYMHIIGLKDDVEIPQDWLDNGEKMPDVGRYEKGENLPKLAVSYREFTEWVKDHKIEVLWVMYRNYFQENIWDYHVWGEIHHEIDDLSESRKLYI